MCVTAPSNTLPRTSKHEEAVEKDLTHLKLSSLDHDRSQETLSQQIAQMQKNIEALGKKKQEESDDDEDFSLPLKESFDLDAMNRKIEKSRRSRKVLVSYSYFHFFIIKKNDQSFIYIFPSQLKQLDTAGGNGKSAIVREILKRLIHKSLGKSMTWVGRGGTNVAFGDTSVAEIIIRNFFFILTCKYQHLITFFKYRNLCKEESQYIQNRGCCGRWSVVPSPKRSAKTRDPKEAKGDCFGARGV